MREGMTLSLARHRDEHSKLMMIIIIQNKKRNRDDGGGGAHVTNGRDCVSALERSKPSCVCAITDCSPFVLDLNTENVTVAS